MAGFTDSKGTEWELKVTMKALRNFERRAGVRFFKLIREALPENIEELLSEGGGEDKTGVKLNIKLLVNILTSVFSGFDVLAAFIFECRRKGEEKINYDEFCDRIEGPQVFEAITAATAALVDCVAGMAAASGPLSVVSKRGDNPLGGSAGSPSTP